jgi:hypothetical protein
MLTWLSLIEEEIKATGANAASASTVEGRAYCLRAMRWAEGRIDEETHQTFAPIRAIRSYDATRDNIDFYRGYLFLDYPLVSASSVAVNGGDALTLWDGVQANKASANYTYRNRRQTPYYTLQGLPSSEVWSSDDPLDAIEIDGIWVCRRNYVTEGWRASGDTVQSNPLSSSATSITVTDADGVFYDGTIPRFSPGMLIQIESEWLSVEAVNTSTNVLTVIRGVRGSSAASHAQNTAISVWIPDPNIQRAATRWVAYMYHRRAVYEQFKVDTVGGFVSQMPTDIPEEVAGILTNYTLKMFRSAAI